MIWYKLFAKVYTDDQANLGSINIKLGTTAGDQSEDPFGRRYYTDLRFDKIENFDVSLITYLENMKAEID